jgi:hypothetical protein
LYCFTKRLTVFVKQQVRWQHMHDGIGYAETAQQNAEKVEECRHRLHLFAGLDLHTGLLLLLALAFVLFYEAINGFHDYQ